jgi:hypothetical protein
VPVLHKHFSGKLLCEFKDSFTGGARGKLPISPKSNRRNSLRRYYGSE